MTEKHKLQKYKTAEELQEKIDDYFNKKAASDDKTPYIVEMCVHLGISRNTLFEYEKQEDLQDTIKRAKAKCEAAIERGALSGKMNATFSIFNLKNNYKWKDETQQTIDANVNMKHDEYILNEEEV